ncbi:RrF2 family transcriptional regulator [Pseudohalocynthiibacter aestuariivivens]|jgi:Rrf2 family protein|uniref:RrF2 family transcriptional regulator n=1 Tax=Pseudohalocynthiibacter aestuariivivens TaxID=1591409 RepID=A0ABV5JIT1_9RHOB|nr:MULTISPECIES: Rrf2 family transcriptional regulator [Pseudohalocynthiibacter]MBS9718154.1 Rrf2 family transcriptional regulator [Pseudohalocynthiibacter aestuariivivens]MCK0103804.1 Rrf2 family transcriptional regulator [Pseudohalocynthiibacter sp. F2068]
MRLNEGVEWAVHSCSLMASLPEGMALPARKIAEYFDLPEAYLAKIMQQLSVSQIVTSRRGPGGGYRLTKSPDEISLLDIVVAIDGNEQCFQCTEIRRRGPTASTDAIYNLPCGIARSMWKAEQAWRNELSKVSLRDIQMMGFQETPKPQLEKAVEWFKETLS